MRRDLPALAGRTFDVVVIGGGICGACVVWDATLRGLSAALIERGDFCGATSAHSLKVVHGGIRYLQHADVRRVRESCHERSAFLRIAPHLVHPLPFLVPTYGHGMKGKEALWLAFRVLSASTLDRNRGIPDPDRRIPAGRLLSRDETLRIGGGLVDESGLTGAGTFHDGQLYNPPRLVLSILRSAANAGAVVANYCEAKRILHDRGRVLGVSAVDTVRGDPIEIRARTVVNAAGPFAEEILVGAGLATRRSVPLSRDMAVVIGRPLVEKAAVAIQTKYRDPDAIFSRGNRHLFVVPWRGHTLIGVNSKVYEGAPSDLAVGENEVAGFLEEIDEACPGLRLSLADVTQVYAGLLPFGENAPGAEDLSFGKRSLLIDHAEGLGIDGLISTMSVRFTTGRSAAERAVDLVARKLGMAGRLAACRTDATPVHGGAFRRFSDLERAAGEHLTGVAPAILRSVLYGHGAAYRELLPLIAEDTALARPIGGTTTIGAEVVQAVRAEMALTLPDVVLRRTDMGTAAHPGDEALRAAAALMARELSWDSARIAREIDEATAVYPRWARSGHVGAATGIGS
jgi:glycerol-3-phosphate dehydrogenase